MSFEHEFQYEEHKGDEYEADYPKTQKYWVTNPWEEKPIPLAKKGMASYEPTRVFEVLALSVKNAPDSVFWKKEYLKEGSENEYEWKSWTRQQVFDLTKQSGRAFIACGLKPWQAVSIVGFNAPEWIIAFLGCIHAGGIAAGIYTTNNPGQCKYIAEHSKSAVAVVENKKQLDKFLEIRDELKELTHIVVWDMDESDAAFNEQNDGSSAKVIHWNAFMKMGEDEHVHGREMEKRIEAIKPGMCCSLIYTSGTTGPPKAVMISHDNVTWQSRATLETLQNLKKDGSPHASVSYLPLSHVAAQLMDIFYPIGATAIYEKMTSWEVFFARPTALKGTLKLTLKAARPTLFFGVPRVWEKIQEGIIQKARENPRGWCMRQLITFMKGANTKAYYAKQCGGDMRIPWGYSLAQKKLVATVKDALGLDRVQGTFTGAAPTSIATLEFWGMLGIDVIEAYGMSETCGLHTISLPFHNKQSTVGVPLTGCSTWLEHQEGRDKAGNGEICMRGRHIMMGYMYDEDKTKQCIDDDGFVHSGDVGTVIEEFNLLKITGRIKELIITAGGENIAPIPIEDYLKAQCEAISNVMVIGDRKKYLTALLTLKVQQEADTVTFTNDLVGAAKDVDPECATVTQARDSEKWKTYIQSAIDKYNADQDYCVSNAQKIQYYRILDNDFGVESGELTGTMKLKRPVVAERHLSVIESMYK